MSIKSVEQLAKFIKDCKGFDKVFNKVKLISVGDGKLQAELKLEEEHTNLMGGLHGGLSATLIDSLSSYALGTKIEYPHVSVDIHTTYLKGATIGDTILIDASVARVGKTLAFLNCDIKSKATGDVLVKGSHTKYILRPN